MEQNLHDVDAIFDALIIGIPQMNLLVKALNIYLQGSKIHKLNELLKDPIFAMHSNKDEKILLKSKMTTDRLFRYIVITCTVTATMFLALLFIKRYYDPTSRLSVYTPFEVNSWGSYSGAVFLKAYPLFWMGCGHLCLDYTVVLYFCQMKVQLEIIKSNIENLFDSDDPTNELIPRGRHRYNDEIDQDIKDRFIHYVKRYENLLWFSREVNSIFNIPISINFLTSMVATCAATYIFSTVKILSFQGLFMLLLIMILSAQVFFICYFGNLVQFESESLASAVYLSNWYSASPRFRRILLIAMLCWSRPLSLTVSGVVPISLDTFVSYVKSAYTLYAVNSSMVDSKQQ
ncbi:odorant receptor 19a-like [Trichoplusia ni]|uniref:Odorant receptor n=1 Tax=Trichoplusia ni TaxID=7111 RepID=A0A7E5VMS9_TRINI|nr:odorant receptor 19a-like [Trichoplusia ni]